MKIRARILSIKKDDMKTSSARCIYALLEDNTGMKYRITWAKIPTGSGRMTWASSAQNTFDIVWEHAKCGDHVWLYYPDEPYNSYFSIE